MACGHTKNCELFPQFALNPALKVWQTHYCEGEFAQCARYRLSLEGKAVPLNLLPNGKRVETPRTSTAYGAAALFNAILKDRAHMVESLLRTGVDISTRNPEGMTPLMAAASRGNIAIIRLLLSKGADVTATNLHGANAHDLAVQAGCPQAAKLIAAAGGGPSGIPLSAPAPTAEPMLAADGAAGQPSQPVSAMAEPATEAGSREAEFPAPTPSAQVVSLAEERTRALDIGPSYCLRIPTRDAPELAREIARACSDCYVAVEAMVRKPGTGEPGAASVIVLTGPVADTDTILRIVRRLETFSAVSGPVSCMRLESLAMPELARTAI
ncbi:MAG: ankyrin repeat domain-containing protein [Gammaproteobacteria bacterium]|nr:ankyrin repeat domain-containing protein [Gammaproteobacteria bacterium]